MTDVLNVEGRDLFGKLNTRRMRRAGKLPAILYGHGQGTVSLTLCSEELERAMRHGARLFDLKGKVNESALIRDIQWDTYAHEVLHVDFVRVNRDEKLTVEVEVVLRGVAAGTKAGGVVSLLVHSVEIETTPAAIPERLHLNINPLELDGTLTAADIEDMPPGATLITESDTIIAHCILPVEKPEEEELGEGAEPEIIGRKASDEEGDAEEGGE
jgi:large subunit ribosomal protein L25